MRNGSLLVVGVLVIVGCVANAQQIDHSLNLSSLRQTQGYVPRLALSDARAFPFGSSFAWMQSAPNDFLPNWRPDNWDNDLTLAQNSPQRRPRSAASAPSGYSKDLESSGASVALRKSLFDSVHGEVGFFYGHSAGGRHSLDTEGAYINATTGNDKVQISVGGFYENTNVDFQRRGR